MTSPERESWLMRSIRREYHTNLGVGVFLSLAAGFITYLGTR